MSMLIFIIQKRCNNAYIFFQGKLSRLSINEGAQIIHLLPHQLLTLRFNHQA